MRLLVTADLHYDHARSRTLAEEMIERMNQVPADLLLVNLEIEEKSNETRGLEIIRQLKRREREAIALRFGGDLTTAEVAGVLGVSVPNAQQILSRALRMLHSLLAERAAQ